jgi:hypothetical protein
LIVTLEYGLFTSKYPGLQFITPKERCSTENSVILQ